jgi:predicted lipoprotein
MKKIVRYILVLLLIAFVGYKSVYVKKLSTLDRGQEGKFDAIAHTQKLWSERLTPKLDSAIAFPELAAAIQQNPEAAFEQHAHAMAIGNYRYSLVRVNGRISQSGTDEMIIDVPHADSLLHFRLATEYVYGNAIRDASGLLDIREFSSTADLNTISEEMNRIVRTTILPPFKKQVKQGDSIEVTGAVEFNKAHVRINDLELIPVRIKIIP